MKDKVHKIIVSNHSGNKSQAALFIDRDGVINKRPAAHDYVKSWDEFSFNSKVFPLLKKAKDSGFLVIIVTNQRGISRGLYSEDGFLKITEKMLEVIRNKKIEIDGVYYCPHGLDDKCGCRKPSPGLFIQAIKDFSIDPQKSIVVGDSSSDLEAGRLAGVKKRVKVKTNLANFDMKRIYSLLEDR